jgi:hypothetical protein
MCLIYKDLNCHKWPAGIPRNSGGGAENRGAEELPEEEEGWESAKDPFANYKNFKGLKVKLNFPLLQGSNGKMTKIENV